MTTITRRTKRVELAGGGFVVVREMAWPKALQFIGALGDRLGPLAAEYAAARTGNAGDDLTPNSRAATQVARMIAASGELAELLLQGSLDDSASGGDLSVFDALAVIDAAVDLNLSQEVIERGKALAATVAAKMG